MMKDKRRRRLIITLAVIAAVILVVAFFYSRLNAPHEGVVVVGTPKSHTSSIDMTPKQATGNYVMFNYPAGLNVVKNNPLVDPVVEQFNYMHRDIESWNLAIAVMKNPGGSVSTNNTYQVRKINPDKYKESSETINGKTYVIMTETDQGGFSKVAIMQHGSMGATVSLYGDDPSGTADLQKTFDMVLGSWQWN